MPRADRKVIDAAIRRARWGGLIEALRRYWLPLALVVGMIALFVFSTSSPPRHVAYVGGEIMGLHHQTSEEGRVTRAARVLLDDGGEVLVTIPSRDAVFERQRVVVEILRYEHPPKRTIYRFDHYETEAPRAE